MATIPCKRTLCSGGECPIKGNCSRYEKNANCAPDYDGVAFFIKPPWDGEHCENFLPMKEKDDGLC